MTAYWLRLISLLHRSFSIGSPQPAGRERSRRVQLVDSRTMHRWAMHLKIGRRPACMLFSRVRNVGRGFTFTDVGRWWGLQASGAGDVRTSSWIGKQQWGWGRHGDLDVRHKTWTADLAWVAILRQACGGPGPGLCEVVVQQRQMQRKGFFRQWIVPTRSDDDLKGLFNRTLASFYKNSSSSDDLSIGAAAPPHEPCFFLTNHLAKRLHLYFLFDVQGKYP
jgi:hypothetical protein